MLTPLFVWILDLLMYYAFDLKHEGLAEEWTNWSFFQLFGYFILFAGNSK